MVNQIDGAGNATPHGKIFGLPVWRPQGGTNAVVLPPAVGDIGMVGFARRDISSVKATRKISNPGSRRRFDWADGIYLGGVLNAQPTQYIVFTDDGIELHSPTLVKVVAPTLQVQGDITATGNITAGEGGSSVTLLGHEHPTAPAGPPSAPTPGT